MSEMGEGEVGGKKLVAGIEPGVVNREVVLSEAGEQAGAMVGGEVLSKASEAAGTVTTIVVLSEAGVATMEVVLKGVQI